MPLLETRASASVQGYGLFGSIAPTGNFYLIQQLSPSAVSTVTFSSIPASYKSLQVRFNLVSAAGPIYGVQFNADTSTANYASHYLEGNGSTAAAGGVASGTAGYVRVFPNGGIATSPMVAIIDVPDYANASKNKTVKAFGGANNNATGGAIGIYSGIWLSTAAITSLTLISASGTYTGTVSLYGVS